MDPSEWRLEQPSTVFLYHHFVPQARTTPFLFLSVSWAFTWLLWRAYQVIQTPNEILVDKLGLDIPPAPELILKEIRDSEIHITWKQVEPPNSIQKHVLHVNCRQVGETKRTETAVAVLNLAPQTLYEIRVFTVSVAGFRTPSRSLLARTTTCQNDENGNKSEISLPTIRILHTKPIPAGPTALSSIISRDTSGGQSQSRYLGGGRKQSPVGLPLDQISANLDRSSHSPSEDEDELNFARLQGRLQKLQQENEATECQITQEEEEFESTLKELESRRDGLKQSLKERDEMSTDLKKQVHKVESASRAAQNERSKKERLLRQKEGQRAKRRKEGSEWEAQIGIMEDEIAAIERQKAALKRRTASSIAEVQHSIREEQMEVKNIEEDNRAKITHVKALEEERKRLNAHEETDESREADQEQWVKDRQWQETLYNLNATYASLAQSMSQANVEFNMARERLAVLQRARVPSTQMAFPTRPPPDLDAFRQGIKQRRGRATTSLASTSSPTGNLPSLDAFTSPALAQSNPVNTSPTFVSGTSFFSSTNGMTLMGPPDASEPALEDIDNLTANAPMSPRANLLLPANLLGDESADDFAQGEMDRLVYHSSAERIRNRFNGIRQPNPMTENFSEDPSSPKSSSSCSASIFLSPRESLNNLADPDGQSTHSVHVSVDHAGLPVGLPAASRNFVSGIFGFNRQRGKTTVEEPPTLGALKSGESQSFPRNFSESLDPLARRRRLSYGGNWAAPVTNLFPRTGPGGEDKHDGASRLSSGRRGFPNLFSSSRLNPANLPVFGKQPASSSGYDQFAPRNDSGDFTMVGNHGELPSSRPSSVYSFDRLPRPSTDSQPFGWGAPDRSNHRGSPLAADWFSPQTWSRTQSRRQSLTHGSTSNVSMMSPSRDVLREVKGPPRPLQAPIGTRPASSQKPVTPKLNPAAPSFTTLFVRNRDRPKEKGKSKDIEVKSSSLDIQHDDSSPPDSRKSRDSRSVATAASLTASGESLDQTPSGTPSDTPPSKETFIQKITRKSSSNKFNAWKEKGGLFTRKGELPTPDDINEDFPSDAQPGLSLESMSATSTVEKEKEKEKDKEKDKERGARPKPSWNFMRKSRRGEKSDLAASEVSESSERASEMGDEEVHDRHALVA